MAKLIDTLRSLIFDPRWTEPCVLVPGCSDPVPLSCLVRTYQERAQQGSVQESAVPCYPVREVSEEVSATLWRLARTED
jgi:hypothetical protein